MIVISNVVHIPVFCNYVCTFVSVILSLAILFHFLCAQHFSDINIFIIRSLRLFCWITTLVVLFLVQFVLEFRCGWVGVASVLQAEAQLQSWFGVCWSFSVVGLEWPPCCRLKHSFSLQHGGHSNPTTPKLQHTPNQDKLCFSLQHGGHSNPTTPKLQHKLNQEQYDQCGNSTE